jgi:hypothetical protein
MKLLCPLKVLFLASSALISQCWRCYWNLGVGGLFWAPERSTGWVIRAFQKEQVTDRSPWLGYHLWKQSSNDRWHSPSMTQEAFMCRKKHILQERKAFDVYWTCLCRDGDCSTKGSSSLVALLVSYPHSWVCFSSFCGKINCFKDYAAEEGYSWSRSVFWQDWACIYCQHLVCNMRLLACILILYNPEISRGSSGVG